MARKKKRILLTPGDPNGIGPEIAVKALLDPRVRRAGRVVVVGPPEAIREAARALGVEKAVRVVEENDRDAAWASCAGDPPLLPVIPGPRRAFGRPAPGRIQARAGRAAFESIERACRILARGGADALVTGPVSKAAIHRAGLRPTAHTELLAKRTGCPDPLTLFVTRSGRSVLRIAFLTRHLPLARAVRCVKRDRLVRFGRRLAGELVALGIPRPRLAVAALNPHAGEGGLLGREEREEIRPAVRALRRAGFSVEGPVPADAVFHAALEGAFDGVISLYHDQGHVAAKTLDFFGTVSMTLGLPFLRTSVDHGTGFDRSGKNQARPDSLIAALLLAARTDYWPGSALRG